MPDGAGQLEFSVLGPLEVRVDGRLATTGGTRQRALLAVLLLHANELVPTERLIEEVWGDDPPATAHKMVQVFVSRLRAALESDRLQNRILLTRPSGYLLAVRPEELDLARFQALVGEARSIIEPDPSRAAASLRSALALWRGAPLSDLALEPFAQLAIPRLEELRLAALEDRIRADLAIGLGGESVGEIRDLVAANPLRERFLAQLMLALYRAGRQAEALDVYGRARATLIHELGIEPGPELQRLQGAVLRQEAWLDAPGGGTLTGPPPTSPELADFRQEALTGSVRIRPRGARSWPKGRRLLLLMVAFAVAGGLCVALVVAANSKRSITNIGVNPIPNSVVVVDPGSDTLIEDLSVGAAPGPIAVGDGSAWIGNVEDHTLTRIDLQSGKTMKTLGLASAPTSLGTSAGLVWIGNGFAGTLSRLLTAYDQLSAPFFPGPAETGVLTFAAMPNDLWVGLPDQTLLRLDPHSLQPRSTFHLPGRPRAFAVTADAAWLIDFRDAAVTRFDFASGDPTAIVMPDGTAITITSGFGAIWVSTSGPNQLLRIDPESGRTVSTIPLGFSPSAMVADGGAVWVVGGPTGTLARVDPNGQSLVTTIVIGRPIGGIAIANGRIWLTLD
jgi:DNA-binding SARP family transcriptional activator/streptogramin lyase